MLQHAVPLKRLLLKRFTLCILHLIPLSEFTYNADAEKRRKLDDYFSNVTNRNRQMNESWKLIKLGSIVQIHKYNVVQFAALISTQVHF